MKSIDIIYLIITIAIVLAAIFFLSAVDVSGEEIILTWDAPIEVHDGVKIFQKTAKDGDVYDYSNPITTILFPGISATINVLGEADAVLKYQWVARAYRDDIESIDSNEVSYKVVNIPPLTPVGLSGYYDTSKQVITLRWEQPADDWAIDHWVVYYRLPGREWAELGRVDDGNELTLTQDFNVVNSGEQQIIDFAVVAFRRSGVFSANSLEHSIEIDRRTVDPVQNLRIEVDIPL